MSQSIMLNVSKVLSQTVNHEWMTKDVMLLIFINVRTSLRNFSYEKGGSNFMVMHVDVGHKYLIQL